MGYLSDLRDQYLNGTAIALLVLLIIILLYLFRKQCLRTSPHKSWTRNLLKTKNLLRRIFLNPVNRNLYDEGIQSESEEAILTRFIPVPSDQPPKYAQLPPPNVSSLMYQEALRGNVALHSVIIGGKDPLEVAERGRVGIASSECSSNSSGDTLPENSVIYLTEERRELHPADVPFTREFQQQRDRERRKHRRHSDGSERRSKSHRYKKRLQDITDVDEITSADPPYLFVSPSREHLLEETMSQCNESLKSPSSIGTASKLDPTDKFAPSTTASYGSVEIALLYDAPMRKMTVHVLQARDIPIRGPGQVTYTQLRLLILPSKKQKHKTKIRTGENPQFMESFLLHRVNPEEVNSMGLRIRVYSCARMRREHLIGESIVKFGSIDLEYEANMWLTLEPKTHVNLSGSNSDLISLARSDSISSTASVKHGGVPELLLGLAYNGTTGRLTTEIIKGIHFRQMMINKTLDTYCKLCLVNSIGQEMSRAKSSIRRAQLNPLFKETFTFQIALFQLNDVTLMVSVYSKRNMKRNEMIGWFSLGLNSSGPDEMNHWNDMRETTNGELIVRWHVLLQN